MNAFLYACIFIMLDNKAIVHCLTEFQNESNNQAATINCQFESAER